MGRDQTHSGGTFFETDVDESVNTWDWAGLVGANWVYHFDTTSIVVDVRWVNSLRSMAADDVGNVTNQTFELAFGWSIPL